MAVLHILLGILKIAGILLAVLLGLLLLILSCMLFCPVVYQGAGEKNQDSLKGSLKISWLFRGISLKVWYEEGTHYSVRICGISTEQFKRIFKRRAGNRKKTAKRAYCRAGKQWRSQEKGVYRAKPKGSCSKGNRKSRRTSFSKRKVEKKRNGAVFCGFSINNRKNL